MTRWTANCSPLPGAVGSNGLRSAGTYLRVQVALPTFVRSGTVDFRVGEGWLEHPASRFQSGPSTADLLPMVLRLVPLEGIQPPVGLSPSCFTGRCALATGSHNGIVGVLSRRLQGRRALTPRFISSRRCDIQASSLVWDSNPPFRRSRPRRTSPGAWPRDHAPPREASVRPTRRTRHRPRLSPCNRFPGRVPGVGTIFLLSLFTC